MYQSALVNSGNPEWERAPALIRQRNICFNKQIVKFFLFRKKMPYREVYYNLLYSNSVKKRNFERISGSSQTPLENCYIML